MSNPSATLTPTVDGPGATPDPITHDASSGTSRFRLFTTATSLVGVLAFCVADGKPLLLGLAFTAALLSRSFAVASPPLRLPRSMLNGLVIVSLLYSATMVSGMTNVISDLTDFLTIVLMLKFFDRAKMRDEAQLLGLSMFVVIGAVLTGAQLALGLTLVLYTPLIIACVIVWQVHRGSEWAGLRAASQHAPAATGPTNWQRPLARVSAVIVTLSLATAVAGFLVTPRVAIPGGAWGRPLNGAVTGFSDQIKLGSAGLLSESSEPVMDVVISDDTGQPVPTLADGLYLRGAVLDYYDTSTGVWRKSDRLQTVGSRNLSGPAGSRQQLGSESRRNRRSPAGDNGDERDDGASDAPHRARTHLVQNVTVRNAANGSATPLFALLRPVEIGFSQTVTKVEYVPEDATLRLIGEAGRLTYTIKSALDFFDDEPAAIPLSVQSSRVISLAASITARPDKQPEEAASSPQEVRRKARQITNYLRDNFRYNLEMVAPDDGEDPIDMFLFRRKEGHCEYFASAMTALSHAAGIHARIITGYVGGEKNPVSGSYLIRASDAHAWVEVQTSPGRWETFDPTPPSELQHNRRSTSGVFGRLRQLWDALEMSWGNNVIAFEQSSGKTLNDGSGIMDGDNLRAISRFTRQLRARISAIMPQSALGIAATIASVVAGVLGLSALARAVLRRSHFAWPWSRRDDSAEVYPAFYAKALARLSRDGITRPRPWTPRQLAAHLQEHHPLVGQAFSSIVERYYEVRFGGRPELPTDGLLLQQLTTAIAATEPETRKRLAATLQSVVGNNR